MVLTTRICLGARIPNNCWPHAVARLAALADCRRSALRWSVRFCLY